MRFGYIFAAALTGAGLALIAWGGVLYFQQAEPQHATADITVMPCSAWDNGAQPVIPSNTFTGACVNADGSLITR